MRVWEGVDFAPFLLWRLPLELLINYFAHTLPPSLVVFFLLSPFLKWLSDTLHLSSNKEPSSLLLPQGPLEKGFHIDSLLLQHDPKLSGSTSVFLPEVAKLFSLRKLQPPSRKKKRGAPILMVRGESDDNDLCFLLYISRRLGQGRPDLPVEGEGPRAGRSRPPPAQVHAGAVQKCLLRRHHKHR